METTTTTKTTRAAHAAAERTEIRWDRPAARMAGVALIAGALITGVFNALHPLPGETPEETLEGILAVGVTFWKLDHLMLIVGFWLLAAGFLGLHRQLRTGPAATTARLGFHGVLMTTAAWTVHDAIDGFARAEVAADWAASTDTRAIHAAIATTIQHVTDASFPLIGAFYWLSLAVVGIALARTPGFPAWTGPALATVGAAVAALSVYALFLGFGSTWDILFATGATLTLVWALASGAWLLRRTRAKEAT